MCQYLTFLAINTDYRYIARCEHGCVHLGWDFVTFHLEPDGLIKFSQLLEAESLSPKYFDLDATYKQPYDACCFKLNVGNVCLNLPATDVFILLNLVKKAMQKMVDLPAPAEATHFKINRVEDYRQWALTLEDLQNLN